MRYVDGYVLPVPRKNLAAYRRMALKAGKIWREHGALEYIECVADDVKAGKHTSFPQSVKLKPAETVVFAYIVYEARRSRPGQRESHEGSSFSQHDGPQGHVLRRETHVLGRVQGPR